jgi:uncharacterized protein (TIGR03083 family)
VTDLAITRASLVQCYDAIESLCARMDDAQWQVQSLCPDWTARGVINHLIMMERVMTGWLPSGPEELPHFDRVAAVDEQMAALDDTSMASLAGEIFAARRADLAGLTQADMERVSWTPVGVQTYGRFLEIRIFDLWVHERDITTPLHWAADDGGARAEIALGEVAGSLGYIVGKKIGLPDGTSIVFHLTGPVARDLSVVVDGRAKVVDHVAAPDVELTTDTVTFIQLACGRLDPQEPIDSGAVTWTGDAALGDRAARNLRFTM